jgi:hypothetical protein
MIQDSKIPTCCSKTPMGTRKYFSENYRQFGQALSKRFASPSSVIVKYGALFEVRAVFLNII